MANTTIYHYRIYLKGKTKIELKDFQLIKKLLFDKPIWTSSYSQGKLVSYSTPLIFEISEDKKYIELLIEPYKNTDFLRNIDEILELNKFDFWTIGMSDVNDVNFIYLQTSVDQYSTSRKCKYRYDEILIYTNKYFKPHLFQPQKLNSEQLNNKIIHYRKQGEYHSAICMGMTNKYMNSGLGEKLVSKDKFDIEKFDYDIQSEPTGWFSDDKVYQLVRGLKNKKGIDKVEFFFDERLTRKYEIPDITEVLMKDDWSNCADEEFQNYINEKSL